MHVRAGRLCLPVQQRLHSRSTVLHVVPPAGCLLRWPRAFSTRHPPKHSIKTRSKRPYTGRSAVGSQLGSLLVAPSWSCAADNVLQAAESCTTVVERAECLLQVATLVRQGRGRKGSDSPHSRRSSVRQVCSDPRVQKLCAKLARPGVAGVLALDTRRLCEVMMALCDMEIRARGLFSVVSSALRQKNNFQGRCLVEILTIMTEASTLDLTEDGPLLTHLLQQLKRFMRCDAVLLVRLASTLSRLASIGGNDVHLDGMLEWLIRVTAMQNPGDLQPTVLSAVLSAASKLEPGLYTNHSRQLQDFAVLAAILVVKLPRYGPKDLGEAALALGKLSQLGVWTPQTEPSLAKVLSTSIQRQVKQNKEPHNFSKYLFCLAQLSVQPDNVLMVALTEEIQRQQVDLTPLCLAECLQALSQWIGAPGVEPALCAVFAQLGRRADQLAPPELVLSLLHLSRVSPDLFTSVQSCLPSLLSALRHKARECSPKQLAVVWTALVSLGVREEPVLSALSEATLQALQSAARGLSVQHVADILLALSRSDWWDEALAKALLTAAVQRANRCKLVNLVDILQALSGLAMGGSDQEKLLHGLCVRAGYLVAKDTVSPQHITTVLRALAQLQHKEPACLSSFCEAAYRQIEAFHTAESISCLLALGQLDSSARTRFPRLVQGLCRQVTVRPRGSVEEGIELSLPQTMRLLQALVLLGVHERDIDAPLSKCLIDSTRAHVAYMTHNELLAVCTIFSQLRRHTELVAKVGRPLCKALTQQAKHFDPSQLSDCYERLAKLQWACAEEEGVFAELSLYSREKAQDFKPEQIAITLSALVLLKLRDDKLVSELAGAGIEQARSFSPRCIARTTHALTRLAPAPGNIFAVSSFATRELASKLCDQARERADQFSSDELLVTKDALEQIDYQDERFTLKVAEVVEARQRRTFLEAQTENMKPEEAS
eukprot:gb/GEZN01001514.1/.p1 GENE.gb/GEZN01001514.1/~~gb/GEZN01001514.1/.p1  ORF type:complete len:944 (+),score=135.51 gb/GEZN01001514.1/:43-2874(+)